jgi:cytochrome c oxidase subunit 3
MGIIHDLTEKPWLVIDRAEPKGAIVEEPRSAAPTGLKVYFAVATVMFSLIAVMYVMRMGLGHAEFGYDWQSAPKPWLLWLNTGILVVNSIVFQRARAAARMRAAERLQFDLLLAGLFAFAFLAGQLLVWRELIAGGYYLVSNPANAFFYLLTAAHGLHMLGGLVAWGRITVKAWYGVDVGKIELGVELCAVYWHFLLIVWLAMFYLLLTT